MKGLAGAEKAQECNHECTQSDTDFAARKVELWGEGQTEGPIRLAPCGARSGLASFTGCEGFSKSCCKFTPSYSTKVVKCQ